MPHRELKIGLFGFGVVGEGIYQVLKQTPSLNAEIRKICIKNPEKKRNAPTDYFTADRREILDDPEINVVVEVINDSEAAFEIVSTALRNGKDVISASKKMIAGHLPELLQLQSSTGRSFIYESAACASIPLIRNLEEYYDNDLLHAFRAVVNGSTNYILTKIFDEHADFKQALIQAQQSGFAETDPTLDVNGNDAVYKWTFLLTHAYGIVAPAESIPFTGIQHIRQADAQVAKSRNCQIKLVAQAKKLQSGKVAAFVLPQFVKNDDPLAFVKNEFNGAVIESAFADNQFFYGKGAGSFPTASAILSDISALRYGYRYEYKKLYHHPPHELAGDYYLRVYVGFEHLEHIPRERFEWMEEWHTSEASSYLAGVIHARELHEQTWWKENNNSLILLPEPVVENIDLKKIQKRSLELAGVI